MDRSNVAILGALLVYWCLYAIIEIRKPVEKALWPRALWGEIVLYSVLILASAHTVLQSKFNMNTV